MRMTPFPARSVLFATCPTKVGNSNSSNDEDSGKKHDLAILITPLSLVCCKSFSSRFRRRNDKERRQDAKYALAVHSAKQQQQMGKIKGLRFHRDWKSIAAHSQFCQLEIMIPKQLSCLQSEAQIVFTKALCWCSPPLSKATSGPHRPSFPTTLPSVEA